MMFYVGKLRIKEALDFFKEFFFLISFFFMSNIEVHRR